MTRKLYDKPISSVWHSYTRLVPFLPKVIRALVFAYDGRVPGYDFAQAIEERNASAIRRLRVSYSISLFVQNCGESETMPLHLLVSSDFYSRTSDLQPDARATVLRSCVEWIAQSEIADKLTLNKNQIDLLADKLALTKTQIDSLAYDDCLWQDLLQPLLEADTYATLCGAVFQLETDREYEDCLCEF